MVGDCASAIHPRLEWEDALFRFEDTDAYAVTVLEMSRQHKDAFYGGFMQDSPSTSGVQRWLSGVADAPVTIQLTHRTADDSYLSEPFAGTDQYINLWADYPETTTSNLYTTIDPGASRGQQCIAGYCRVETAWMLVR